jgi:hypothetical protein
VKQQTLTQDEEGWCGWLRTGRRWELVVTAKDERACWDKLLRVKTAGRSAEREVLPAGRRPGLRGGTNR